MADGLSSNTVYELYEDREGTLWVATASGLDSFSNRRVTSLTHAEGLSLDEVYSVLATRDGTVWAGENGALDSIRNGVVSSVRVGHGLPGHQVTSMLEDRRGRLWVGVDDELYLYEGHHFRPLPEPNHRPLGMVVGLTEDSNGDLWAECASNPRKLVRIRDFRIQEEFSSPRIPDAHAISADPHGGIWLFTLDGNLALFRNGVVQTFPLKIRGVHPLQIEAESDGSVLAAGASGGLIGLRQGRIQQLTVKNGIPCDGAYAFVRDQRNNLWLETPCGYLSVADSEIQRWWTHPDVIVHYRLFDTSDGARTNQIPFHAASRAPDGRLWFAGWCLQIIDPDHLGFNSVPPPVHIEQIVADHQAFEADSGASTYLHLPPLVHNLEIDYAALSLIVPAKVLFRYKLDGTDHDWRDAGNRRQAFYTNLPPGSYHFHVIACNNDGVWNDAGALFDFSVAPAYYQTIWFRSLCAILLMLLLWMLYRFRLTQVERQFHVALEARVDERTRIARDLHDTLLQSFQGLLLRFQAAANLLPGRPQEAKQKLDQVIEQTSEAIAEGRDAVQGLRTSTTATNDLAVAIRTIGEELADEKTSASTPKFDVMVESHAQNLHPIVRDEVYRIAAEALRNAFRHAEARQIRVEIRYDAQQLCVKVYDDGKGIDPYVQDNEGSAGHWGIRGMRERAKLMGGKVEIWSKIHEGTEVELTVPASTAYDARTSSRFSEVAGKEI
jgi:signal transduction histidine kinase